MPPIPHLPVSHGDRHKHGGPDEIATATPTPHAIPKALASGQLDAGWFTGGISLPVDDTTSLVRDPADPTREGRIDVGAVATGTTRTLVMPNQDIDLTPNTGTFPAKPTGSAGQVLTDGGGGNLVSNSQVTIGAVPLTVSANASPLQTPTSGTHQHLAGPDGVTSRLLIDGYGAASQVDFRHAAGTASSPSAVQANSNIGVVSAWGYGSSGYVFGAKAGLFMRAAENWTNLVTGTYITIHTTKKGGAILGERVRFDDVGNILHGTTTPATGTATKVYVGGDNAGHPVAGTGTGCWYFTSVSGVVTAHAQNSNGDIWRFQKQAAITQTYATATATHANPTSATLTDSTGGTANTTVAAVSGSGDDATINDNFADLVAQVNALRADLLNAKQVINTLVDYGQTIGAWG